MVVKLYKLSIAGRDFREAQYNKEKLKILIYVCECDLLVRTTTTLTMNEWPFYSSREHAGNNELRQ